MKFKVNLKINDKKYPHKFCILFLMHTCLYWKITLYLSERCRRERFVESLM